MSNIPTQPAGGAPDPDVQDLAAKHNIPIEEAEQLIAEKGNDRGEVDAEVQNRKLNDQG